MIMELPRKFNSQYVSCTGDFLKIHQIVRFEELMYELAKAIKGKRCIYCGKKLKESNYTFSNTIIGISEISISLANKIILYPSRRLKFLSTITGRGIL